MFRSNVYGYVNKPEVAWDLKEKYKQDTAIRTCFKQLAINIYGPAG